MPKIIGKRGQHQIGQVTSRERGELVTQVGIICADGSALPPVWIFPRVRYDEKRMMKDVVETGALGLVHKSGWMTSENFLKVLQHIVKFTRCSREKKILLIMDNHESHLTIAGLDFCKENGIVVLTIPPHTSNKTQPLDRTVFGPFKTFCSTEMNSWMLTHPGETVQIYDIPVMASSAWDKAATRTNIKSGFRCTGIFPYNRNIFMPEEFLASYVTDRPMATGVDNSVRESVAFGKEVHDTCNEDTNLQLVIDNNTEQQNNGISEDPPTSLIVRSVSFQEGECSSVFITPEQIKPYPKAGPRKNIKRGPKKRKCMIATDTPEKDEIAATKIKKYSKPSQEKLKKVSRKIATPDSSENDEEWKADSSDDDVEEYNCLKEDGEDILDLGQGRHVIVKVYGKSSARNYVAEIIQKQPGGYEVKFYKRHYPTYRFTPSDEESAFVLFKDISVVLPLASKDTRARYLNMLYFNVDLTEYSLL